MSDLQLISSVFVLTVNLACTLMLWVMRAGSRPKTVLALLSTLLVAWNLFAVLLVPELRFERLSFYYEMATTSGAALIYIYLLYLMRPSPVTLKEIVRLYIPPLALTLLYHIVLLVEPPVVLESYRDIAHNLGNVGVWMRIAGAVCFLVYCTRVILLVIRLYPEHRRQIAKLYSYRERIGLGWVPFVAWFFVVYGLVVIIDVFFSRPDSVLTAIFNFFFAAFYLTINLVGVRQQDVYSPVEMARIQRDERGASMPAATRNELKRALPELMETRKVYLDPELRLDTVAQMLGTNRTYISSVLNEEFGKSFIVWVNEYRIDEAKRIMTGEDGSGKSISAIAEESGFKSHSSFVEFFRRQSGVGPSEFRRKI